VELSEREQEIYDLRHSTKPPMPFRVMAEALGMDRSNMRRTYKAAERKLKEPYLQSKPMHKMGQRVEVKDPEKAAEFINVVSNPLMDNLSKAIREVGLPPDAARHLMARLNSDYQPVLRELQRVKTDHMVREFENLSVRAVQAITDDKLENTSAYQLALIGAIAADKRELLDGRPTERISHEDRLKLPEVIEALMAEANRRGLVKTINPETGHPSLTRAEGVPFQVAAARERVEDVEVLDDLTGH